MLHSIKELQNYDIQATDGDIGKVRGFYFDDNTWEIHYLVVDTNKWLPGRKVLVSPAVVRSPDVERTKLPIDLTVEKIKYSPAIEEDIPIVRSVEDELNSYYGWRVHKPSDLDADDEFEGEEGDLRSTYEVTGFYVEADDGDVGHVEDFIIDDEDWTIKYVVIDTKNWWPGKKVLINVEWIDSLGWDDKKVFIALSTEEIKHSPEFDYDLLKEEYFQGSMYDNKAPQTYWTDHRPEM